MNKEDYKTMVEAILNDETYYSKSNINPEKELQLKYKKKKFFKSIKAKWQIKNSIIY